MLAPPTVISLPAKLLVGKSVSTSLAANQTGELFRALTPRKQKIPGGIRSAVHELRVYPVEYYRNFDLHTHFTQWVAVKVDTNTAVPAGMAVFHLPAATYAGLFYQSPFNNPEAFRYIFREWLPESGCTIGERPHFDLLTEKTLRNDPYLQEENWVPIIHESMAA